MSTSEAMDSFPRSPSPHSTSPFTSGTIDTGIPYNHQSRGWSSQMRDYDNKTFSMLSRDSMGEDFSKARQSVLLRDLEVLLDLKPSTLRSNLLGLPREVREQIFEYVIPQTTNGFRPQLHTCLWGADMVHEPWRHDIFGYAPSVPNEYKLHPRILLINRQLRDEFLQLYFQKSQLTLHAELRNPKGMNGHFNYSPHVLHLPMLKYVTHIRFYIEWNYTMNDDRLRDQVRMTFDVVQAMDTLLASLQAIENIELSILFFWRLSSGKHYQLTMQDLFDLEDVFKRHAEQQWLQLLRKNKYSVTSPNTTAGVGYKILNEDKGTDQSGEMEVYVSQNLENAMQHRRESTIDFYGNYGISDSLPQPAYRLGAMI